MGMYQEIMGMHQKLDNNEEGDLGDLALANPYDGGMGQEVRFWRWK